MSLLATLTTLGRDSSPALVWHGADGERIELSGRVFTTWVAKTTHLLAEEFDAGPGTVLTLRLGDDHLHWRGLVLAVAAWALDAEVDLPGDAREAGPADQTIAVVAGDAPAPGAADDVLAVALPGLAMGLTAPRTDAVDYVAAVRTFPDVYPFASPLAIDARLASGADATVPSALLAPRGAVSSDDAVRALAALAAGGRVGLTDIADAGRRASLAAQEGLTSED